MKLSEFVLTHTKFSPLLGHEYFAEVSVTTGALWWKKKERLEIHREAGGYWHFVNSGRFTPGIQADNLDRAYNARESLRELTRTKASTHGPKPEAT